MFFQSGIGQPIAYGIGEAQANTAWDRMKNLLTRGPLYRQQGLEKAGLNRILAAGGGVGATTAGSTIQGKSGSAGGGSGGLDPTSKPRLERAQRNAASAQEVMFNKMGNKHQAEAEGVIAGLPFKRAQAAFYGTAEGLDVVRQHEKHMATPNTAAGLIGKGLRDGTLFPKDITKQSAPRSK